MRAITVPGFRDSGGNSRYHGARNHGQLYGKRQVYDGTTAATIASGTLTGVLAGDAVTLSGGTAVFDTKDVGTNKTVTGTGFTLGGAQASNYTLTSVGTTTANITPKQVTGSFTASNKTYDGNTMRASMAAISPERSMAML